MKSVFKLIGSMALAAVIGFLVTGCSNGTGGDTGGGPGNVESEKIVLTMEFNDGPDMGDWQNNPSWGTGGGILTIPTYLVELP